MEKNIYRKIQLILISLVIISCYSHKRIRPTSTIISDELKEDCSYIFKKYEIEIREPYGFNFTRDGKYDRSDVLNCAVELLDKKDRNTHEAILEYMTNYYNIALQKKYLPALIATHYDNVEVIVFSKLRGQKAFELGLKYAEKTQCVELTDEIGGGNVGLSVINHICLPMIKSVSGYNTLNQYLRADNGKNRTYLHLWHKNIKCNQGEYEYYYNELIKAYKEGKIVLKKYGED